MTALRRLITIDWAYYTKGLLTRDEYHFEFDFWNMLHLLETDKPKQLRQYMKMKGMPLCN